MKNYALLATAAALILVPSVSHADYNKNSHEKKSWSLFKSENRDETYERADVNKNYNARNDMHEEGSYRVNVQSEEDFRSRPANHQNVFTAVGGERLQIEGTRVYKIEPNGTRFFAPKGSYETTNGYTIVTEDGALVRVEEPAEVVTVDWNDRNRRM